MMTKQVRKPVKRGSSAKRDLNAMPQDVEDVFDHAIALAQASTPLAIAPDTVFQDEHGIALGSAVTVTAESFGPEPTEGVLVAATRTRYTLARQDARVGMVHVHFPRIGYVLRAQSA